jgi:hypothetical protein
MTMDYGYKDGPISLSSREGYEPQFIFSAVHSTLGRVKSMEIGGL